MQNSGIGNAINPLLSMADTYVYGIPMILIVGQRGDYGVPDEPQHMKQGIVTIDLIKASGIPYVILEKEIDMAKEQFCWALKTCKQIEGPVCIIVRKNTFTKYTAEEKKKEFGTISREDAIHTIIKSLSLLSDYKIISTTGMISRELYEIRERDNENHGKDFLVVGAMGHCSQIALGYAKHNKCKVICLDGDGSAIMHMGNLAITGTSGVKNMVHIVLNNAAHDSVGGQPTVADKISLFKIAENCGYDKSMVCNSIEDLNKYMDYCVKNDGLFFIEVIVKKGSRKDLGRPKITTKNMKNQFMNRA